MRLSPALAGAGLLALVAGGLFFQDLGRYPLWDPDEARHAEIARAFQNVGFPILPATTPAAAPRPRRRLRDYFRRTSDPYPSVFHRERATLITPRDFDLSPYFEIVKLNGLEAGKFDYRRIKWA